MASQPIQGSPTPLLHSSNGPPGESTCQVQVESPAQNGNTITCNATQKLSLLDSQIKTELNKRSSLRSMRLDISSTMNAYAVVLVLLASVTFAFYLQPPGGVDDDGFLNMIQKTESPTARSCSPSCISALVIFSCASFHLAVTGILVCMSCIAFVIPNEDVYDPVDKPIGELGLSLMVRRESELHETLVDINKRVSLALRVAQILGSVANLFFIMSVWSSVFVAERSLTIVLPRDASFKPAVYNPIRAFSVTFYLMISFYSSMLLWKVLNSAVDILTSPATAVSSYIHRTAERVSFVEWTSKRPTLSDSIRLMVRICITVFIIAYFTFLILLSCNVIRFEYPRIK